MSLREKIVNSAEGFVSNLRFSNRFSILYSRFFHRGAKLQVYIYKGQYYFACNCSVGDHISVQESFAVRAYDPFLDQCRLSDKPVSYVNIGANVGAFDMRLLAKGWNIGTGLAVELNPLTAQMCQLNLQVNEAWNTRLWNYGVADQNSMATFVPSRLSIGDSLYSEAPDPGAAAAMRYQVEIVTLQTLLQRHANGSTSFDLLKLDVEQAEYGILRTTPRQILQQFQNVIIEFHPAPKGESLQEAEASLSRAGFSMALKRRSGEGRFVALYKRG